MRQYNASIDENGFLSENIINDRKVIKGICGPLFVLIYDLNKTIYLIYKECKGKKIDDIGTFNFLFLNKIHKSYQSATILVESGLEDEANIIIRVILEHLFIMKAIHKDKNNYNKYIDNYYWNMNKTLRAIETQEELKEIREYVKDIVIEQKGNETKIKMWASMAGMTGLYQNIYRVLSDDVHGEMGKLNQNLIIDDVESKKTLCIAPKYDDIYILGCMLIDFMIAATTIFCQYFNIIKYKKNLDKIEKESEYIYSRYEEEMKRINKTEN